MFKLNNKYILAIITFYIIWLGIVPVLLTNIATILCNNFSHNSNYEISIKSPKFKTYILPVLKFKAENIHIKHKNTITVLNISNFSSKLRLLPLLSGKIHFNSLKADKMLFRTGISKEITLNKDFFKKIEKSKICIDSITIGNVEAKLVSTEAKEPIIYNAEKISYNHKNQFNSLNITSYLIIDKKASKVFVNMFLPKNNDILKTNFDIEISQLDIEPIGVFFKNFLPKEILGLQGKINITANKNVLKTEFDNTAILFKKPTDSIILPQKLISNSIFNITRDLITIKSLNIKSQNINVSLTGSIRDYFGKTMPTVDFNVIVNKSKIEDIVSMLPPFKTEEFNAYKLKQYNFYGNLIGNLSVKGRLPEPEIAGKVFIDDGILIKPIPNTTKGATIKLLFTGKHVNYDVSIPAGNTQKVWVKGIQELYNIKYAELTIKSTQNVNLHSAENVVNPLHEIFNFIIGPIPILDIYGTGNIDFLIKGTRTDQHIWGDLNFYNTDINFIKIPDFKLKNADMNLSFNDTDANLKTVNGKVNGKDFKINGTCNTNGDFNFDVSSENQPTGDLYKAIVTSSIIENAKNIMPNFDYIKGVTDLKLKIYGSLKYIEDLKFNENAFSKGNIVIKDNDFSINGVEITKTNANIKFDSNFVISNIKAYFNSSPISASVKIKNNQGDIAITLPNLNPHLLFTNTLMHNQKYLPCIDINAKYKGNISNIEYDKLYVNAKINPQTEPALFKFKSGDIILANNKLSIKNLDCEIKESKNKVKANLQISNPFSKKPITNGVLKININNLAVLNEIFGKQILPEKINNILKDFEFGGGGINAIAQFNNGKLSTSCDLTGIMFNYIPKELPIEILNGKLYVKNNNIILNKINMLADKMPILANGEIKDIINSKYFDIYINSKPRQDFIDKFINKNQIYPLKIRGDIVYSAMFKGISNDYNVNATIDMDKDSSIYYYGATVGDLENSIVLNLDSKIHNNNEIKIKEFLYDKLITSQNGKQTRMNMMKVSGGVKLLNNDIEFKDLHIKTYNPVDAKIFNIIFRKPNIKQGQFTSDLRMKGKLSNPKILGDFHIVETNIPFLDTTMKNIEFLFKDKNLEINSKGEILGNDIEAHATLKNNLSKPYYIEDAIITTKEMNLSSITNKLKYAVAESAQIQDSFGIFDLDSIVADNLVIKADNITLKNLHATNFKASASLNKDRLFEVKNFIFNIANGNLSGKYSYNFKNNNIKLSMQANAINANDISFAIFDLQNQIYGDLTGSTNLSCTGESFEKCMQTLNGNTAFNVQNGKMPKLGSLEHLLKAGNLLKGGITSLTINNVIDIISPLKTGEFSNIYGTIAIQNGIAENLEITTEGKDLNLFISGVYDFSTFIADMQVFGLITRKVSSMLGPIGTLSVNSIFNIIPGVDLSKDSSFLNKVNKIPGIELSEKSYRKFVADIKGNINGENYVKSFMWIN